YKKVAAQIAGPGELAKQAQAILDDIMRIKGDVKYITPDDAVADLRMRALVVTYAKKLAEIQKSHTTIPDGTNFLFPGSNYWEAASYDIKGMRVSGGVNSAPEALDEVFGEKGANADFDCLTPCYLIYLRARLEYYRRYSKSDAGPELEFKIGWLWKVNGG